MKKKVVSLLLAAAMTTAALAGCGSSNGSSSSDASTGDRFHQRNFRLLLTTDGAKKDAAGEKIAMITDSGDITDESFNQITSGNGMRLRRCKRRRVRVLQTGRGYR